MELILGIFEAAIAQYRRDQLHWGLSLSLVCRTVRIFILPITYEVLFLDINHHRKGAFIGWDGRAHEYPELAFLSWLIHDPSAPPRQHIKHLIFCHPTSFSQNDLQWAGPRVGSEPAKWPFERLTIQYVQDLNALYGAGIRPMRAFQIGPPYQRVEKMPYDVIFSALVHDLLPDMQRRMHSQTWTTGPMEVVEDGKAPFLFVAHYYITCRELDPSTGDIISGNAPALGSQPEMAIPLTVHLIDGDYCQRFPSLMLTGIAAFLEKTSNEQLVFACSSGYHIAGQPLADFIRSAVPMSLPQDAVGRVRISHRGWTPLLGDDDMFHALAHELRCGGDPWDSGHAVPAGDHCSA